MEVLVVEVVEVEEGGGRILTVFPSFCLYLLLFSFFLFRNVSFFPLFFPFSFSFLVLHCCLLYVFSVSRSPFVFSSPFFYFPSSFFAMSYPSSASLSLSFFLSFHCCPLYVVNVSLSPVVFSPVFFSSWYCSFFFFFVTHPSHLSRCLLFASSLVYSAPLLSFSSW